MNPLKTHALNCTGWNNHLVFMYLSSIENNFGDIVEMGMGDGSTRQLNEYCKFAYRNLISYESDESWMNKYIDLQSDSHKINLIKNGDWSVVYKENPLASIVLIDHVPGEDRRFRALQYVNSNAIIVCHDGQPKPNAGDYRFEEIYNKFKYKVRYQPDFNPVSRDWPTGAIALSNHRDITQWCGLEFLGITITKI